MRTFKMEGTGLTVGVEAPEHGDVEMLRVRAPGAADPGGIRFFCFSSKKNSNPGCFFRCKICFSSCFLCKKRRKMRPSKDGRIHAKRPPSRRRPFSLSLPSAPSLLVCHFTFCGHTLLEKLTRVDGFSCDSCSRIRFFPLHFYHITRDLL